MALLFYRRGAERLSLFVMSAAGLDFHGMALVDLPHTECATESYKGYKVLGWKRQGLLFALVTDDRDDGLEALVAGVYRK